MHKYFPETAARMALVGADTEEWLGAIFYRLFVLLLAHHVRASLGSFDESID